MAESDQPLDIELAEQFGGISTRFSELTSRGLVPWLPFHLSEHALAVVSFDGSKAEPCRFLCPENPILTVRPLYWLAVRSCLVQFFHGQGLMHQSCGEAVETHAVGRNFVLDLAVADTHSWPGWACVAECNRWVSFFICNIVDYKL